MVRVISSACINDNKSAQVTKTHRGATVSPSKRKRGEHSKLWTILNGFTVMRHLKKDKLKLREQTQANDTYTLFAVKHIAEVFVGFWVFADESEYPFIGFVVGTEGYPVELTVVQHVLENNKGHDVNESSTLWALGSNPTPCRWDLAALGVKAPAKQHHSLLSWGRVSSLHKWRSAAPLLGSSVPLTSWCVSETVNHKGFFFFVQPWKIRTNKRKHDTTRQQM